MQCHSLCPYNFGFWIWSHIWTDYQCHKSAPPRGFTRKLTPWSHNASELWRFCETNSTGAKTNPAKYCASGVRDPSGKNLKLYRRGLDNIFAATKRKRRYDWLIVTNGWCGYATVDGILRKVNYMRRKKLELAWGRCGLGTPPGSQVKSTKVWKVQKYDHSIKKLMINDLLFVAKSLTVVN